MSEPRKSINLVMKAEQIARQAHEGQQRKYTGEPYINHLLEVKNLLQEIESSPETIAAALLHDVLEDTELDEEYLATVFCEKVVSLVITLTDFSTPKDGNRAQRKSKEREKFAAASNEAKTIKLADILSNSRTILEYDQKFGRVFLNEASLLLPVLQGGNRELYRALEKIVGINKVQIL